MADAAFAAAMADVALWQMQRLQQPGAAVTRPNVAVLPQAAAAGEKEEASPRSGKVVVSVLLSIPTVQQCRYWGGRKLWYWVGRKLRKIT